MQIPLFYAHIDHIGKFPISPGNFHVTSDLKNALIDLMKKTNSMPYKVSEETLKETTRCQFNLHCLNNDDWKPCCIIERVGQFLEINKCRCDKKVQCNYVMPYGFAYYCLCPVRREIYTNYDI
jgi:hypothetical protein